MAIISCTIPSLSGSWWRDGNGILAFGMICYTTGHQHTKCHANIYMQTKVMMVCTCCLTATGQHHIWCIKDMQGFWVFSGDHFVNSSWRLSQGPGDVSSHLLWCIIHLVTNTQIFMQIFTCISKLQQFWVFSGGHFEAARSRVFISYMILTIKNYQYKKFHAFMTIWTI